MRHPPNTITGWTAILMFALLGLPAWVTTAESADNTNAPTGTYEPLSNLPERFVVDLKTNGSYTVSVFGLTSNRQSGVWDWDAKNRQFLLKPHTNSGAFVYEFRVLRVDPRHPDRLQWLPRPHVGEASGANDYVRLKRKDD